MVSYENLTFGVAAIHSGFKLWCKILFIIYTCIIALLIACGN
jgi:hypothetical protein